MTGAAIVADGWIVADTGHQTRERVQQMLDGRQKKEKKEKTGKQEERIADARLQNGGEEKRSNQAEQTREAEEECTQRADRLPQRRWPRPPCMQAAIYRDGKWVEEG